MPERCGVALIGHGFMGAAHSQAWRVAPRFFDLPLDPALTVLVGRDGERARQAAERWGWAASATDWREVVTRDDVDLVDIVTPGDSHAEIALAALAAGKHVLCEKPLANTVAEAEEMVAAAERAAGLGAVSMVGFSYRRLPATALARQWVAEGRIGAVRQVRAEYLQDWLVDPEAPLTWRLQKERAGSGSLGDLGAHAVDLAEYISGQQLTAVSGLVETLVSQRPLMGTATGLSGTAGAGRGQVSVDDVALFHGRLDNGGLASFEATRFRTGRKNALRIEVSGSAGALSFDLERLNELQFYDATDPSGSQGFRTVLATEPEHPWADAWWPTGHGLGYEHGFTHQVVDLLRAVAERRTPSPSFRDGLHIQRVLAAVEQSSAAGSTWVPVA